MTDQAVGAASTIAAASKRFHQADWEAGYALLRKEIARTPDPIEVARCKGALVHGYNLEEFKRGRQDRDKYGLLDEVDGSAEELPDDLAADSAYERGMALHIDFIMGPQGDEGKELQCFSDAVELFRRARDREGAALALAMVGVFHHVDRLDRDAAEPILRSAYDEAPRGPSFARSEATRHLGQIKQERGDAAAGLQLLRESLRIRRQLDVPIHVPSALHVIGVAELELGQLDDAERTLAEARDIAERLNAVFTLAFIARTEADLRMARMVPGVWNRRYP